MSFELVRSFHFEAAHWLPGVPDGHRCRQLHGHSYEVDIHVVGDLDEQVGWVVDFADIDQLVEPIVAVVDHRCLNDIEGLENPTSENLARWIWTRLSPGLTGLSAVAVRETQNAVAIYRGSK